jgi:hypothetical protein
MKLKSKITIIIIFAFIALGAFIFFKYFFTFEQRNIIQRKIESITGQNLKVTIFDYNGKIIKRWTNVQKITSGKKIINMCKSLIQCGTSQKRNKC